MDAKLQQCLKGNHDLIGIYRSSYAYDEEGVVRWCRVCGSVVVDLEYDGRIHLGDIIKMLAPKISKGFV